MNAEASPRGMAMIFDCFPFYNELDLLELRFCELDEVVDLSLAKTPSA
jgi:hypothetical protein